MEPNNHFNIDNENLNYRAGELPALPESVRKANRQIFGNPGTVYQAIQKEPLLTRLKVLSNAIENPKDENENATALEQRLTETQRVARVEEYNKMFFDNDVYITYNSTDLEIVLYVGFNKNKQDVYKSSLQSHEAVNVFKINTGTTYSPKELSNLFKMNRSYFETRQKAMELVSKLQNFKAKVNQQIEDQDDNRGNKKYLRDQVVESNVPASFNLVFPLFKGQQNSTIEVELIVDADSLEFSLISPQLKEKQKNRGIEILDNEVSSIESVFPEIKIFDVS